MEKGHRQCALRGNFFASKGQSEGKVITNKSGPVFSPENIKCCMKLGDGTVNEPRMNHLQL